MLSTMTPKRRTKDQWTPKRLKALRKRLGLSQAKAAARISVARRTWINWENNQRVPSAQASALLDLLAAGKI